MPPMEGRHRANSKGHTFHVNSKTVIAFINACGAAGRSGGRPEAIRGACAPLPAGGF
ncbi:hypothetical protein CHELA40_12265 [Chelatococcus asaccharovorans]|nr:hypothetical protein CHELA40_12265 [Chelatococcus asaccharovorans]